MADLVHEGTGYLGTFFRGEYGDASRPEDQRSPKCVLLTRHYRLTRSASGKLNVHVKTDGHEFPDEAAMVAAIEGGGWFELPAEADGNPQYVPPEFDPKVLQPA
jgi:hypothetical protein